VTRLRQVAQLVIDHIVNVCRGHLDELDVERDSPRGAATAPARPHHAHGKLGKSYPQALDPGVAGGQPLHKDLPGVAAIPLVEQGFDVLLGPFFYVDVDIAPVV